MQIPATLLLSFSTALLVLVHGATACLAAEPVRLPREHFSGVSALAFSPDGSLLVSGADDRKLHVWDVVSQRSLIRLEQSSFVRSIAFSRDGRLFATGDTRGNIKVWETATRKLVHVLKGAERALISSIVFSLNGETLIASSSDVRIWSVKTGEELQRIPTSIAVSDLALAPDGRRLAVATGGRDVLLWDLVDEKLIGRMAGHQKAPTCVAFSPDGLQVVSGALDLTVRRWDVEREQEVGEPITVDSMPCKLAYTPNGKMLVTITTQGTVMVLDRMTGQARASWKITAPRLTNCFAVSPDGQTLATNDGRSSIALWQLPHVED